MEAAQERRQYARYHLLAHGRDKMCVLEFGGSRLEAALIDISAGGARVRFSREQLSAEVKRMAFSVKGANDRGLLQGLEATVQWRHGQEVGVQFHPELDIALGTLQDLVE